MSGIQKFDILPGGEMLRELGRSATQRPAITLCSDNVPTTLRHLIALAEHWGVSCDVTRHAVTDAASQAELGAFSAALKGHHASIHDWLYSFGPGNAETHEAATFRYMLVAELEAAKGPGIPGYLDWACQHFQRSPSDEARARVQDAYDTAKSYGMLKFLDAADVRLAQALLFSAQK